MKKYLVISLALVLGLALTGCGLNPGKVKEMLSKKTSEVSDVVEETGESVANEAIDSVSGTIFDLVGMGKDYKCTFSESGEAGEVSGTTYVSGDRFRGDYKTSGGPEDAVEVEAHNISDGSWLYAWSSMSDTGTKISLDTMKEMAVDAADPAAIEEVENLNVDKDAIMEASHSFDCEKWTVDASKFEVPEDISFVDMNELLDNLEGTAGDLKLKTCDVCDVIPDEGSRETCLLENDCE